MHELSVCRALVARLEEAVKEHQASGVAAVRLRIGPLSGVEPALLEQAFPFAAAGSVAEGARLEIERPPLRVRCDICGAETDATSNRLLCGLCGDWHTRLASGDEMLLTSMEMLF